MDVQCNICGKTIDWDESNDSFPINYFDHEMARNGCCSSCNEYVAKCRRIYFMHPEFFDKKLSLDDVKRICVPSQQK